MDSCPKQIPLQNLEKSIFPTNFFFISISRHKVSYAIRPMEIQMISSTDKFYMYTYKFTFTAAVVKVDHFSAAQ